MSSEPLITTSVPEAAQAAETGLLVVVLMLVLMGTAAILFMS